MRSAARRKPKNLESSAASSLKGDNPYADARTLLAQKQAARYDQIMRKEARQLIELNEGERILVGGGRACRVRLETVEKRLRSAFPELPEDVIAFLRSEIAAALELVADDILRIGEPDDEEGE